MQIYFVTTFSSSSEITRGTCCGQWIIDAIVFEHQLDAFSFN